ncbi:hypothetical protein CGZ98_10175 [Enemella evansiae]|uniref:NAD(P)-dependent oxidoreductase n=1 Tax=Enemella evansiae TaxID=2016499 RepID=UPI000B968E6C|nr:NAD(P)-dependent oxidoreductase [Enemella evansiae]OYO10986.1 hypothetical protein CGZ98_10175 [Enemella evansiae]
MERHSTPLVAIHPAVLESLPDAPATLTAAGMAYETLTDDTHARVLIVGGSDVGPAQLDRAPRAELLVRAGIGMDRIDLAAAAERGITVVNTPGYGTNEVADQALLLLLACIRRLDWQRERAGADWPSITAEGVPRLADSTVGLIGQGAIGRAMARRCRALGCTVIAADPALTPETAGIAEVTLVTLEELAERSDIISLHAPLTTDTHHLVDAAFLAHTRPHLTLINTARGALVDTTALLAALATDPLRTAGLDVLDGEPTPDLAPLRDHDRVIITPHLGWYSEGSRRQLGQLAAEAALDHLGAHNRRKPNESRRESP